MVNYSGNWITCVCQKGCVMDRGHDVISTDD